MRSRAQPCRIPALTRITRDAAFSTEPALSRDGTQVVYASDRNREGQLDPWLGRTAGGEPLPLTDDREPDFSPDGRHIAFRSDRAGGGVYVIPTLGGNPRLVAEGGAAPASLPMAAASRTGRVLALGRRRTSPGFSVFTVPANGGRQRGWPMAS